jgi:hypothetical protein
MSELSIALDRMIRLLYICPNHQSLRLAWEPTVNLVNTILDK